MPPPKVFATVCCAAHPAPAALVGTAREPRHRTAAADDVCTGASVSGIKAATAVAGFVDIVYAAADDVISAISAATAVAVIVGKFTTSLAADDVISTARAVARAVYAIGASSGATAIAIAVALITVVVADVISGTTATKVVVAIVDIKTFFLAANRTIETV